MAESSFTNSVGGGYPASWVWGSAFTFGSARLRGAYTSSHLSSVPA
jgi:hypothetical protein